MRKEGLEPPRLSAPDPKSGAATNYATCAKKRHKGRRFYTNFQILLQVMTNAKLVEKMTTNLFQAKKEYFFKKIGQLFERKILYIFAEIFH